MNSEILDFFTEKQLNTLRDMLQVYKELEREVHNYPEDQFLFTQTQRELFELFDVQSY